MTIYDNDFEQNIIAAERRAQDAYDALGDFADRAVNFGGYQYQMFFDHRSPQYNPLPRHPRPAASYPRDTCRCPHCASEGLYADSPACKFWRNNCHSCDGYREYIARPGQERVKCEDCEKEWREAVDFFRKALRSPAAVARQLRAEAATSRALQVKAAS